MKRYRPLPDVQSVSTESPAPTFSEEDNQFMQRALELAACGRGMTSPNPMVGAVLVKNGKILGEDYHHRAGEAHAEANALAQCEEDTRGATIYVNLEPCSHEGRTPPCAPLLVERGIKRVVVAHSDPNPLVSGQGIALLRDAGVEVDVGLCETEARRLNEAFLTFHLLQRPFITCKWAMTLDGRIASETGQSKWISNEQSRRYVHEQRANADAILIGIGTVMLDNPLLNVRLEDYAGRQPKRIIADEILRIPLRAKCLENTEPGQCIIATTVAAPAEKVAQLEEAGHKVIVLPGRKGLINLKYLISELAEFEIQSLFCEGGSSMHGSLLASKLVDKLIVFIAPKLIGGATIKSPISGWGIQAMTNAVTLEDAEFRFFGSDICFEGYVPDTYRRTTPLRRPIRKNKLTDEDDETW